MRDGGAGGHRAYPQDVPGGHYHLVRCHRRGPQRTQVYRAGIRRRRRPLLRRKDLTTPCREMPPTESTESTEVRVRIFSHRLHRLTQIRWVRKIVAEVSLPPQQQSASHRIRRIHRTVCWGWSPTDFTDLHRWLGCVDPPTEFTDLLISGGALVSSAPPEDCIRLIRSIRCEISQAAGIRLIRLIRC